MKFKLSSNAGGAEQHERFAHILQKRGPQSDKSTSLLDMNIIGQLREIDDGDADEPGFLAELFETFIEESTELVEIIKKAGLVRNTELLIEKSHNLKGACSNVGAAALAKICNDIESSAKKNTLSNINSYVKQLEEIYARTLHEIKEIVPSLKLDPTSLS